MKLTINKVAKVKEPQRQECQEGSGVSGRSCGINPWVPVAYCAASTGDVDHVARTAERYEKLNVEPTLALSGCTGTTE
jgi:hypothetical protein